MRRGVALKSAKQKIETASEAKRFLLIGDAMEAFADIAGATELDMHRCESIVDAVNIAAHEKFDSILIVMSSFNGTIESSLANIRKASPVSKIFLLAKMYEEPVAREMVRSSGISSALADDYFICPVLMDELSGVTDNNVGLPATINVPGSDYKDARIRELELLATQDDLTGLKNRRYMREFLAQIIRRSKGGNLCVTLLVFDIDNFKHYNDAYGHAVGDNVLRQAGAMMNRCCRSHDVVGRIGGDEFAVVFWDRPTDTDLKTSQETDKEQTERRLRSNVDHPSEAVIIAERFRNEISSTQHSFLGPAGKGELTISGGLAAFPKNGETVEELFEQADKAMLEAKKSGKNRVYLVGEPKH